MQIEVSSLTSRVGASGNEMQVKGDFWVEKRSQNTELSFEHGEFKVMECTYKVILSNTQWDLQVWFLVEKYGLAV